MSGWKIAAAAGLVVWGCSAGAPPAAAAPARDSCVDCHRQLDDRLAGPTRGFERDIHARRGLGCAGCHGGDPSDPEFSAMDPAKGFKGVPKRQDIAERCASCHANAAFMKRFNPRPYIFSIAEFRTSVHCRLIEEGDRKVATCTNCHGVHGILPHRDPESPVFAKNVPGTCAKCHNAEYLKGRKVPTDQHELWTTSVHGVAMLEKGDLSAPACNDCHGNHGAAPPGLKDVSLVCGTCHAREAGLFQDSKMKAAMEHGGMKACVTCHGNHGVQKPTDDMLSAEPGGTCAGCHAPGSAGEAGTTAIIEGFRGLKRRLVEADSLLHLAEQHGMETAHARDHWRQANDQLTAVRATLHSFDADRITAVITEGATFAGQAYDGGREALRDWRMRRVGMALSLVVILALMVLLIARIRASGRAGEETGSA